MHDNFFNNPPIAVVATSGIFPQAVGNAAFWRAITNKVDTTIDIPSDRWVAPLNWVYHPSPEQDKAYSNRGCLIQNFEFIPEGYLLAPELLKQMDPLHQWTLHATRHALDGCNISGLDKSRIGVTLAAIALPTDVTSSLSRGLLKSSLLKPLPTGSKSFFIDKGSALSSRVVSMPAAIVAAAFGFGGGSFTLDAACASSLYAVKLACNELQSYRADVMVAGGVSRPDCLYTQIGFSQLHALSGSGRCAPFDGRADGLVVGEGAGIIILKRLKDAVDQGDTIVGVIRGIGLSNDMRGNLLAPESAGQIRAMQKAYADAQWQPQDVDYIECHGAGTPVGDATELESLCTLWGNSGWQQAQCAIGSVKSVVGHLLTAAGAAGMIKTLLALHHNTLPPSLKFEAPSSGSPLVGSPFRVQTDVEPWPKRDDATPRRAAVSAFGFGGINAHVLLEQYVPETIPSLPDDPITLHQCKEKDEPVAIVGMELCLGSLTCLSDFRQTVFEGTPALTEPRQMRWKNPDFAQQLLNNPITKGGFINEVTVALGEFQIPPGEIPQILPQQLLMLKVAAAALQSAGMPLREARENMGAIIGIGFDLEACNFDLRWALPKIASDFQKEYDLQIDTDRLDQWLQTAKSECGPPLTATRTLGALGGIVASRIAREFRLGGPSFVVSAEEASGLQALEIGTRLLQSHQLDAVLVGAVDLFCDERNLAALSSRLPFSVSGNIRPFDQAADGTLPGEGAVALVLKRLKDARADNDRIFAVVEGIGRAGGDINAQKIDAYHASLTRALEAANIAPQAITLVETHGSGIPTQDQLEADALHAVFAHDNNKAAKSIAIGTLKTLVGHTGAASGLASLAKAAISLYHQIIPSVANYNLPSNSHWQEGPFYMPHQPAYWVRNRSQGGRHASVGAITSDGNCVHVVLKEAPHQNPVVELDRRRPMGALSHALFCLGGGTPATLLTHLDNMEQLARQSAHDSTESLAQQWFEQTLQAGPKDHRLAIVANTLADLRKHIAQARQAVTHQKPVSFNRTGGICHTPQFSGQNPQVAFVYPGSGNHYVGMGRALGTHWPEVLQAMDNTTLQLRSQMLPQLYLPWRSDWPADWQQQAYADLIASPLHPIFGQVVFGSHMTALLNRFNLHPNAVIGYSLGESAGLFATGAWPDRGKMLERLEASDLFQTQLVGPCIALRQAWQIPAEQTVDWHVAVVNRSAKRVKEILNQFAHVRLLIINTPRQCVIGGLKSQVQAAIDKLKCDAVFLDGVVTVHCDAAQPVAEAYRDLHLFDTTAVKDTRFYSCAFEKAYDLTSDAAADSILQQALNGFNFPRTIEQAYDDGVRIFLEIGPHASCTGMIDQILKGKPYIAVAANHRSEEEPLTLLKCLGTMAAAGAPVDLEYLYEGAKRRLSPSIKQSTDTIRVGVGNGPLTITPFPEPLKKAKLSEDLKRDVAPSGRQTDAAVPPFSSPIAGIPYVDQAALDLSAMLKELDDNVAATAKAHQQFLDLTREMTEQFGQTLCMHNQLAEALASEGIEVPPMESEWQALDTNTDVAVPSQAIAAAFDRSACMQFAIGSVGKMLGPRFDIIDTYPARVRLPDEPLMLVDRIISVEGEMLSMSSGRVVTEHDVLSDAWYLDGGRAPVCISVEAGQADLFLCAYLGIDHQVKGQRTYRLLDAKIRFHRGLPRPGETIRYDIHIDKFVRQEETYLFFFRFEGHIGGEHLITMTNGCAGFFTEEEVQNSGGIILTEEDLRWDAQINGTAYKPLVDIDKTSYTDDQINALRQGDAARCLGPSFEGIRLPPSLCLPGERMALIHRIVSLDPEGGRFGLGYIKSEADIHPDDWFLTCHFVDDMVMPGTLMYECCAHTLRVLLLRMGWVTENADVCYEPIQGIDCRLKCRGPVTPDTRHVHYAIEIKEIGYHPEPYVIADAHMYADDHYIVFFNNMSMQMTGITGDEIEAFWQQLRTGAEQLPERRTPGRFPDAGQPLFTREHILAFAVGRPSQAFGEPYEIFDEKRKIARLPGPPYCFMDRVVAIEPPQWKLAPGGWVEAQYDVPAHEWYFGADRSGVMPFCVLLEIALQPCGWLAAYAGSALKSQNDLKFRNLGGKAKLHRHVIPTNRTLTMRTRITKVSEAADMIIENFDFEVWADAEPVYTGTTYFGFFTAQALAQQVGLREEVYRPNPSESAGNSIEPFDIIEPLHPDDVPGNEVYQPQGMCMPSKALLMIDGLEIASPQAGPQGLGFYRGYKKVDPEEWFFKAHFYQDPVCPGSLGIESFLQLVKYAALQRWPDLKESHRFEMVCGRDQQWSYRGQVIPSNEKVLVDAVITEVHEGDAPYLMADGCLQVDGIYIYKMEGFGVRLVPNNSQET